MALGQQAPARRLRVTTTSELLRGFMKEFAESDLVTELVVAETTQTMADRGVEVTDVEAELIRLAVTVTLNQLLESLILTLQFDL